MRCSEIKVIKKDGTKEEFNVQKVVVAVNKSAERAMIRFLQGGDQFYLPVCGGKSGEHGCGGNPHRPDA